MRDAYPAMSWYPHQIVFSLQQPPSDSDDAWGMAVHRFCELHTAAFIFMRSLCYPIFLAAIFPGLP